MQIMQDTTKISHRKSVSRVRPWVRGQRAFKLNFNRTTLDPWVRPNCRIFFQRRYKYPMVFLMKSAAITQDGNITAKKHFCSCSSEGPRSSFYSVRSEWPSGWRNVQVLVRMRVQHVKLHCAWQVQLQRAGAVPLPTPGLPIATPSATLHRSNCDKCEEALKST